MNTTNFFLILQYYTGICCYGFLYIYYFILSFFIGSKYIILKKFIRNVVGILDKVSFLMFFEWTKLPLSIFSVTKCWFDIWLLGIFLTLTIYFILRIFKIKKITYKKWEYIVPIPDEEWTRPMYLLHVSVHSGFFALFIDSQFIFYHFYNLCVLEKILWVFVFIYTFYWFLLCNFFIIFDFHFLPSLRELKLLFNNDWLLLLRIVIFLFFISFLIYSFYWAILDLYKIFFS